MPLALTFLQKYINHCSPSRIAWALFICLVSTSSFATDLLFLTHSSRNQTQLVEGELRGIPNAGRRAFYVELVRTMMLERDVAPVIHNVPLARGMREVQTKDNVAFFNVTRTPMRENTVKWVVELLSTSSYLYELAENPSGIVTLEDARSVQTIGVLRGGIHESKLSSLGFTNLHAMESYDQILSMLRKGRINLTASSRDFSTSFENDDRWQGIINTQVKISDSVGYLCFSSNVPDEVIKNWQDAYEKLRRQGTLEQLKSRYLFSALKS